MGHCRPIAFGIFAAVVASGSAVFAAPVTMSATVHIDNDWGSGYCATVRLTNTGTEPTASWTATLDLNGTKASTPWNAGSSISGTVMTLTSVSFNGMIQPGKSIEPASSSPGFCATGTQPRPTSVTAHRRCRDLWHLLLRCRQGWFRQPGKRALHLQHAADRLCGEGWRLL